MKSYFHCCMLLVLLCSSAVLVRAQEEVEFSKQWLKGENAEEEEWRPTLLNAAIPVLQRLSQFNGFAVGWSLRGENLNNTFIDGINWSSPLSGWNSSFAYAGMYKSFRQVGSRMQYSFSDAGYGEKGNTQFLQTKASLFKKSLLIGTGFSNSSYATESHLQWSSGKLKKLWYINTNLIFQEAGLGVLANGFKRIRGGVVSMDKLLANQQSIGWTFWWDVNQQGKQTPSVKEVYELSQRRNYNPNWGWYHGRMYFPNSKKTNAPHFLFRYEKKWSEKTFLNANVGIVFGKQEQSGLDWMNSYDPRPDYYRKLPSFFQDSALQHSVEQWYAQHPEALQMNFDQLEKVNQSNKELRSFYIINTQVAQLRMYKAALHFQYILSPYWQADVGLEFASDKIDYSNRVQDLLGGSFYYNYNGWVNNEGFVNQFQFDIQNPDKKIRLGEQWGAHFAVNNLHAKNWLQISKTGPFLEYNWGMHFSNNYFFRQGFNQNGLFPEASLGRSTLLHFPSLGAQAQLLYKISGKYYLKSILFKEWSVPSSNEIYINPNWHSFQSPFLLPEIRSGVDLTFYYRGINSKITLSGFWKEVTNQSEKKMFYHDLYNSFVYGFLGQMNAKYHGVEFSWETHLWHTLQLDWASTFGRYRISNNPFYELRLVNDLYKVESGVLEVRSLPISSIPEIVQAISVQYRPNYNFSASVTGVLTMNKYINHDLFRRSGWVRHQTSSIGWGELAASVKLPNLFALNAFVSKSFDLHLKNRKSYLRCSASVRNILDSVIPILAFEQSRFDYRQFQSSKYAIKYLFDQGRTYTISLQYSFL